MGKVIDSMKLNGEVELCLKEAIRQDNLEFEWIFGEPGNKDLTKELFISLKHYLDGSLEYSTLEESNSLDLRCEFRKGPKSIMSNIRATLEGVQQIKQYCLQDNFDDLNPTFMKKTRYQDPKNKSINYGSASSGLYPCRSNLKQEIMKDQNSDEVRIFLNNWSSKNKYFRYKKRYSYVTMNKMWRIDLTAVKSSDKGRYMNQFKYSNTFREAGILQKNETFELEIEYIGSVSSTFELPPIYKYAEFQDITPFNLELGNIFTGDVPFSNDEETQELSYADDSPRYSESPRYSVEFDEPAELPDFKPYIPDKITIKDEFWKVSKQEEILEHIQDNYKRFMKQDWKAINYKFIPLQKRHLVKSDWTGRVKPEGGVVEAEGEHILVSVSPTINIKNIDKKTTSTSETVIQTLLIPVEYINEDMFEMPENRDIIDKLELDEMEEYSPSSPRGQMKKQKGGGSSYYSNAVINRLLEDLEKVIHDCFTIIYDTPYYLDSLQESDIRIEYIDLVDPKGVLYKSGWYFMGPQPVSMSIEHVHPLNPNSIVSKYVVTEKADGIRAQLFINNNLRGYLITPKKEVIDTGIIFEGVIGGWLFDGEYITKNKKDEPIKLFMIFDVYYSNEYKEQPFTLPWLSKKNESRSKIIHKFKEDVTMNIDETYNNDTIRIGYKQYLEGPQKLTKKKGTDTFTNLMGIFKSNKKIIGLEDKTGGFEYETDGLIFLPMFLPVKGLNENDIVKTIKGTWPLNYKWKPPHENTIDFKVIFEKDKAVHSYNHMVEDGSKEIRYYQKVKLAVGYDAKQDETIDFNWSILTGEPYNKQSYQYFDPPDHKKDNIHLTNIPLKGKRMICSKDGKDIKNGSIIEMRYEPDSKQGFIWVPLRVRDDKIKPQFFTIANNIWNTINEPVTQEMICGTINFDEIPDKVSTDKYYVNSKLCEDTPIRSLHNYIKSKLISRVCSSKDFKHDLMIADLSCGRGGDIKKYTSSKNKIEFIMGLDISSNINEAAQRYYYLPRPKPKSLFLQFDTCKSVEKKEGCLGSKDNKETSSILLDIVLGNNKSVHKKYKEIQKEYSGIAKKGFDVVSSQFSLHYYFKDEETLRGFCENIVYLCADDGYFIGTCYDGMKLMKTFAQEDKETLEMKDDFGSLIYQIKKKYSITDFSYDKDNIDNMFGQEIDVFMASIGQPITEYLVNFEFFIDIMKEYGFELALPSFGKGEYNPIKQPIESFDKIIGETSEIREKDNNFVKKTRNNDLYKVHSNKEYKLLSGLNNWFIFQKK